MTIQTTSVKTTRYGNERNADSSDDEQGPHTHTSSTSVEEQFVDADGKVKRRITTTTTTRRHGSHSTQVEPSGPGFITRFSSLPVIKDSVSTLHSYAMDNKYGRKVLDTANSTISSVNKYTEGYQKSIQPTLNTFDQYANKGLDVVVNNFPIVASPTAEIVDQVKKPFVKIGESSEQAYTQLSTAIDTHVTSPAKSAATDISNKASTAATQIATSLNAGAVPIVDGIETVVNRYLPGEATTGNTGNQATRVFELTRSVSSRVSTRLGGPQSTAEFLSRAENNVVFSKSKQSLLSVNSNLSNILDTLRSHVAELQDNVTQVSGGVTVQIQTKLGLLNESVLKQFGQLSIYLKEYTPKLPEVLQSRFQPLVAFVNQRYLAIKSELAKTDVTVLQKARNILVLTTEESLPVINSAAQEIKTTVTYYQASLQENIQKGLNKVSEANSTFVSTATRSLNNARVSFVGAK